MVQRRKKKNVRMRGSKTHGYGSMKKHRGAGHRGGRGNAGSGKRADSKKPSQWKTHVGGKDPAKTGFFSWTREDHVVMNAGHLSSIADRLVGERKAAITQGAYVINLRELGVTKLLSAGKVTKKLKVSVPIATPNAVKKIVAAGGNVDAEKVVDKEQVKGDREAKATALRATKIKTPAPGKKDA
jgi:large subunit ribosomal protein L15